MITYSYIWLYIHIYILYIDNLAIYGMVYTHMCVCGHNLAILEVPLNHSSLSAPGVYMIDKS